MTSGDGEEKPVEPALPESATRTDEPDETQEEKPKEMEEAPPTPHVVCRCGRPCCASPVALA